MYQDGFNIGKEAPESVQRDVIDYTDVKLKNGVKGLRVTLNRMLTEDEKTIMRKSKHLVNIDGVCQYRYAPEIQHSYFYIV